MTSLDRPLGEEEDASFGDLLPADAPGPEDEVHISLRTDALKAALGEKSELADYVVTQMCFDAAKLAAWLHLIRARGITLAAWIGLPGVFDRSALLAASLRIGVGASLRQLRNRGGAIGRLLAPRTYRPDALLYGLAPALAQPALGIAGFHLFCFNAVAQSEDWRRRFLAESRAHATGASP